MATKMELTMPKQAALTHQVTQLQCCTESSAAKMSSWRVSLGWVALGW